MAPTLTSLPEALVGFMSWLIYLLVVLCMGALWEALVGGVADYRLTPEERADIQASLIKGGISGPGKAIRSRIRGLRIHVVARGGRALCGCPVPGPSPRSASAGTPQVAGLPGGSDMSIIGWCMDCGCTQPFTQQGKCAVCGSGSTLFRRSKPGGIDSIARPVVQSSVGAIEGATRCESKPSPAVPKARQRR